MKTLLMTAIAAVFALQVQAQIWIYPKMLPLDVVGDVQSRFVKTVNSEAKLLAIQELNRLNSLPKIDSIIQKTHNEIIDNDNFLIMSKLYFDYNKSGQISSITKTDYFGTVMNTFKWNYFYENDKLSVIETMNDGLRYETFVISYDEFGKLSHINRSYDNKLQSEYEFNPDETVKKYTDHSMLSSIYKIPTTDLFEYDDKGRILKRSTFQYLTYFLPGKTAYLPLGDNYILNQTEIVDFSYIEPTAEQPYLIQEVAYKRIDSLIPNTSITVSTSAETYNYECKNHFVKDTSVLSTIIDFDEQYLETIYNAYDRNGQIEKTNRTVKIGDYFRFADSTIGKYSFIEGNISQITDAFSTITFFYKTSPYATRLKLNNNKTITVEFNCELDQTADMQSMLAIILDEKKADMSVLAIQRAYVNPTNAKELVIELNRPLEVREGFELYSTQDLPLKDGRAVPVSLVAQGSAATGAEQNVSGEISVLNDNGTVTVSAPQGIASAAMYSVAGMLVAAADGGNASEATISVGTLSSGLYYVHVTDGYGNASVQPVAIGK